MRVLNAKLVGKNGHFAHGFTQPDAFCQVDAGATVDEPILPSGERQAQPRAYRADRSMQDFLAGRTDRNIGPAMKRR